MVTKQIIAEHSLYVRLRPLCASSHRLLPGTWWEMLLLPFNRKDDRNLMSPVSLPMVTSPVGSWAGIQTLPTATVRSMLSTTLEPIAYRAADSWTQPLSLPSTHPTLPHLLSGCLQLCTFAPVLLPSWISPLCFTKSSASCLAHRKPCLWRMSL